MRSGSRGGRIVSVALFAIAALAWLACLNGEESPARSSPEEEGFRLVMADAPQGAPLAGWRAPGSDRAFVVGGQILRSGGGFVWSLDMREERASTLVGAPGALWWIHGTSETEMWVVGERGFAGFFSGRSLRELAMPDTFALEDVTLYGVWTQDGDEVWAVGVERRADASERGVLLRSTDRDSFQEVDYGFVAESPLYKVWGSGPNDVFVVGDRGIILRWDGASWARLESGTDQRLGVVHGRGPNQVWAAGGSSEGILLRWDGATWRRDESLPSGTAPLYGLWVAPEDGYFPDPSAPGAQLPAVLYVSGTYGTVGRRYENGPWVVQDAPETPDVLHSVLGWSTDRALALGGNLASGPPYTGVVLALSAGFDDFILLDGSPYYRNGVRPPSGGGGGGFQ